jgi:hypothetical protein
VPSSFHSAHLLSHRAPPASVHPSTFGYGNSSRLLGPWGPRQHAADALRQTGASCVEADQLDGERMHQQLPKLASRAVACPR